MMTHLLMRKNVAADFALFRLHQFDVRFHAFFGELSGKEVIDVRIRVQSRELRLSHGPNHLLLDGAQSNGGEGGRNTAGDDSPL